MLHWYSFQANFQTAIGKAMPQIIALLQHGYSEDVRIIAAEVLLKLSEYCEIPRTCGRSLPDIRFKPNFEQLLGKRSHRLLPSFKTTTRMFEWRAQNCYRNFPNIVRSARFKLHLTDVLSQLSFGYRWRRSLRRLLLFSRTVLLVHGTGRRMHCWSSANNVSRR